MKKTIFLYLAALFAISASSCDGDSDGFTRVDSPIVTSQVAFTGEGRIHYTVTGPTWDDPNIDVGDVVFRDPRDVDDSGYLTSSHDYLAAYVSGATPVIEITPQWQSPEPAPSDIQYDITAVLYWHGDPVMELGEVSGTLDASGDGFEPITITAATALPVLTAREYEAEISYKYTVSGTTYSFSTRHILVTTWKAPVEGTPLYGKILRWGAEWLDNHFPDTGPGMENQIAERLLKGMASLADLGYRYGPFPRPSWEEIKDRAEVFLDFKQSACGEFRGFFMALVESQGIDANWLWFWFNEPSSTAYSMYETIYIAALGTEPQVWRYQDHIVVEVNGVVYDPTYLVIAPDADTYEDFMFARFCYGEDRPCQTASDWCTLPGGPQGICTDNPPGYVEGVSPHRFRGDDYK